MTGNRVPGREGKIVVRVDPDIVDLIPGFLENRRKDLEEIEKALEGGNYEEICKLAHTMKGVGGGYGFDAITDICKSILDAAGNSDDEGIRRGLTELSGYLERVEVVSE